MKVIQTLNRGGFGCVEQIQLDDGSFAARKVFSPEPDKIAESSVDKLKARFRREVRVQHSLPSEYFLPVLEYDLEADEPWFLMPLADKTLASLIREDKYSLGPMLRAALSDVLNALEELHGLGFVHRDLKPENILLHEGTWKLADLGLVLPLSGTATKLTSLQSTWGTRQYCAPEQAEDFSHARPAADLYAFGCILHDSVTRRNRVPYQRQTAHGPIGWIIEKCTETQPGKRFRNVASLRSALFSVLADQAQPRSQEAGEWVEALRSETVWNVTKFEEFVRFLRSEADEQTRTAIYLVLDEDRLRHLRDLDEDLWTTLVTGFCEWTRRRFEFEYCDVLVRRLEVVFERGTVDVKALAAISTARLASSHNRYFVMRRLLAMCDGQLDEKVAMRIAIEITVEEVASEFISCARAINRSTTLYHPRIASALSVG